MREATGSTFVYGLAISFTLIFAGFLVLAIQYNRAYKMKNEVTSMLERYEGITGKDSALDNNEGSINLINRYLKANGYTTMGNCEEGEFGIKDLDAVVDNSSLSTISNTNTSERYYYCIKYLPDKYNCKGYFRVTIFFDFNLPVFGNISRFNIKGQTNEIYPVYLGENQILSKTALKSNGEKVCA